MIVFEDEELEGFGSIARLRHTSLLRWGTKTLLEALVEKIPDATDVGIWGRQELAAVTKEAAHRAYNERVYGPTFLVNARARPSEAVLFPTSWSKPFIAVSEGMLVAARLDSVSLKPGVIRRKDVSALARRVKKANAPPQPLFRGYWDLVESNGLAIVEQAKHFEESVSVAREVEVRGSPSNIMIEAGADVESHVTLDGRVGPIIIEKGASVESFSRIMGPCYIGSRTRLFSALIGGGTSIFEACKIGGQVDNSIILPFTNKQHFGYVGDSYIGSWVNLGAGSTFSNIKNTYGNVRLQVGEKRFDSGMLKLGPLVGDMVKVSIGALVYAGKSLGTGSHVTGLASSDVPSFTFFDSGSHRLVELRLESVLETQRRMMERRGLTLSRDEEGLIRRAFTETSQERTKAGVRKGPLQ